MLNLTGFDDREEVGIIYAESHLCNIKKNLLFHASSGMESKSSLHSSSNAHNQIQMT